MGASLLKNFSCNERSLLFGRTFMFGSLSYLMYKIFFKSVCFLSSKRNSRPSVNVNFELDCL